MTATYNPEEVAAVYTRKFKNENAPLIYPNPLMVVAIDNGGIMLVPIEGRELWQTVR